MKPMAQEGGEILSHTGFAAKGLCELRIHGEIYFLVEDTTTGTLLSDSNFDAIEVGYCQINGRTYAVLKPEARPASVHDLAERLTERELEITTLVALGWPNKQIADKLHISEWTISTHLRRVFVKLGVHSRAAMVYRCAALLGLGHSQAWHRCAPARDDRLTQLKRQMSGHIL